MSKPTAFSRKWPLLGLAAVLITLLVSIPVATLIHSSEPDLTTISACVNKGGEVKIIEHDDECKKNETKRSWPLDVGGVIQADTVGASAFAGTSPFIIEAPIGTERMRVDDTTGNVGINTANPSAKLDVNGTTALNGNVAITGDVTLHGLGNRGEIGTPSPSAFTQFTKLNVESTGIFPDLLAMRVVGDTRIVQGRLDVSKTVGTVGSSFSFDSGVVIFFNVNVGIDTINPSAKLDVVGDTELTGNVAITGDVTINSNLTVDSALFVDGSNDRVGIGNTTPQVALDLSGDMILGARAERVSNGDFSNNCAGWTLGAGWICLIPGASAGVSQLSGGTLSQDTSEAAGDMYVVTYTLGGMSGGTVTVSIGGASGTARTADGTYTELITAIGVGDLTFSSSNDSFISINDVSVERYTGGDLVASGNVGIGTTSPSEKLHVFGNIFVTGTVDGVDISAHDADPSAHHVAASGPTGATGPQGATGATGATGPSGSTNGWVDDGTVVRLDTSTDDVGIGTASPLYKLHVVASGGIGSEDADGVSLAGNVPIVAQSDTTAFLILNSDGRQAFALNIDGNLGTTGARGIPTFYDNYDGTGFHSSIFLFNGTVGIGQASIGSRLSVKGSNSVADGIELHRTGAGSDTQIKFKNEVLQDRWLISQNGSLPEDLHIYAQNPIGSVNEQDLILQADEAGSIFGAVGIGTADPKRRLHINDVMRLEPRSAAPTSPSLGDIYVDSDTNELCFYDGTSWTGLKAGGVCA